MKKAPKPPNQGSPGTAHVAKNRGMGNLGNGTGQATPGKGGLHVPRTRGGIGGSRKS